LQSQLDQFKIKGYSISISSLRGMGAFALISGFSIALNVFLNFRLLRWYFFMKGVV
jgi:hypothetical protein